VLAAGPELIEDIRRAPDDVLSLDASAIEVCMLHSMGCLTPIHDNYASPSKSNTH
jgi:hypothetical protein